MNTSFEIGVAAIESEPHYTLSHDGNVIARSYSANDLKQLAIRLNSMYNTVEVTNRNLQKEIEAYNTVAKYCKG